MTAQVVGYKLIEDATGAEVHAWGGTWGICAEIPNPVILPNGDQVCGWAPGTSVGGYTLAPWSMLPDMPAIRERLKSDIDRNAETARMKYVTPGAGQALTYDRKRREAMQAIDDLAPTADKYPVLSASIGIEVPNTGNAKSDFDAISSIVIGKELQWAALARVIEVLRLSAKKSVDAASTPDEAESAAQVTWP